MSNLVVHHRRRGNLALTLAHDAQRMLSEVCFPVVAPTSAVEMPVLSSLIGSAIHDRPECGHSYPLRLHHFAAQRKG